MLRKPPGRKARKRYRLFKPTMKKTAFILITILLFTFPVSLSPKTNGNNNEKYFLNVFINCN